MFVSNYARAGREPTAVAISQGIPKWFKGRIYRKLAPPWNLVREKDEAKFRRAFMAQLKKLDARQVLADLGDDAILLCWEKPGEFCHRQVVAEWLEAELGVKVPEWRHEQNQPEQEPEQPKETKPSTQQLTLFDSMGGGFGEAR